jgi:branched-chain amino acid aminotransferase
LLTRKQVIAIISKMVDFDIIEKSISPFDLQKADELFISNTITGIQPITKYRKKEFTINFSKEIINKINASIN